MSKHGHAVTRDTMEVGAQQVSVVRHAPVGTAVATSARYLNEDQVAFFWEHGYLRMEQVFVPDEMDELDAEMDRLMVEWANYAAGWSGDWRKVYMDEETEKQSKLIAMHDLWYYSAAWTRAVLNPNLVAAMSDLLGPDVELHHATMHVKPPETGHPFPMHQDNAFYAHRTDRFIDTLVHLDDTHAENGEIRFLDGSHKLGPLDHVRRTASGEKCTPHLPTGEWHLEDTVAVPARRGDVVCFNLYTVHGSYLNRTARARRMVRVGYRDPRNEQIGGQSSERAPWMVAGQRRRGPGMELYDTQSSPLDRDR